MQKKRLALLTMASISDRKKQLAILSASPYLKSPQNFVDAKRIAALQLFDRLEGAAERTMERKRAEYKEKVASLTALSPLAVLSRGYGVSYDEGGKILKSVKSVKTGDKIKIRLSDGVIYSTVNETQIKNEV